MSFLKKLFGDKEKNGANKKPDIDSLLLNNTDKLILDLDTYLCELSSYGGALERLSEPQKTFTLINIWRKKLVTEGLINISITQAETLHTRQ